MATQLRIYDIDPGHLDEFVAAWVGGVRPLRLAHGFRVRGWTVPGADRFIWLLTCAGSQREFDARDAAYYASPDRATLDPDPARWIRATEHRFVDEVAATNDEVEDLA
jgi:hypothetical protein